MDNPNMLLDGLVPVLCAILTAGLGWWQWTSRRRAELVGLYVNPYLVAAEELQSRLYNVLERGGLGSLLRQGRSPEDVALEMLYLSGRYFGWERVLYEHGPYTKDSTFVRLTQELRKEFATDRLSGAGPFCIFRIQQADLGQLVVHRVAVGGGFQNLPLHEFSATLEASGLRGHTSIEGAFGAFKSAAVPENVRERLARVQGVLVDLLKHIEDREGIRLFGDKEREKARITVAEGASPRMAA